MKIVIKKLVSFILIYTLLATSTILSSEQIALDSDKSAGNASELSSVTTEELSQVLLMEQLAEQVDLCKNADGTWKREAVDNPKYDEYLKSKGVSDELKKYIDDRTVNDGENLIPKKINCVDLINLEFEVLKAQLSEEKDPEAESKALRCVSKGWSIMEQLDFARNLERMGQLSKGLEEHFNCPGKKTEVLECVKDVSCNLVNSVSDASVARIVKSLGIDMPRCPSSTDSSCFNEIFWGIWEDLVSNWEGVKAIGNLAWKGVKGAWNWFWEDTAEMENQLATKQIILEQQEDGFFSKFVDDPLGTTQELFSSLMTSMKNFVGDAIKDNFGCAKWSSPREDFFDGQEAKCIDPVVSWDCATCGQKMNMICGIGGVAIGEIVTAFLTGGAVNIAKSVGKGAATLVAPLTKLGSAVAKTSQVQKLGAGIKGVYGVLSKAGLGIASKGGKLGIWIGNKFFPRTKMFASGLMTVLKYGKKGLGKFSTPAAIVYRKTLKPYMTALEQAYFLGYRSMDDLSRFIVAKRVATGARVADIGSEAAKASGFPDVVKKYDVSLKSNADEMEHLLLQYEKAGNRVATTKLPADVDELNRISTQLDEVAKARTGMMESRKKELAAAVTAKKKELAVKASVADKGAEEVSFSFKIERQLNYDSKVFSSKAPGSVTLKDLGAKSRDVLNVTLPDGKVVQGLLVDRFDDSFVLRLADKTTVKITKETLEKSIVRNYHNVSDIDILQKAKIDETISLKLVESKAGAEPITGILVAKKGKEIHIKVDGVVQKIRLQNIDVPSITRSQLTTTTKATASASSKAAGAGTAKVGTSLDDLVKTKKPIRIEIEGKPPIDNVKLVRVNKDGTQHVFVPAEGHQFRFNFDYDGYIADYSKIDDGLIIYRLKNNPSKSAQVTRAAKEAELGRIQADKKLLLTHVKKNNYLPIRIGDKADEVLKIGFKRGSKGELILFNRVTKKPLVLPSTKFPLQLVLGAKVINLTIDHIKDAIKDIADRKDVTPGVEPTVTVTPTPTPTPTVVPTVTPSDDGYVDPKKEEPKKSSEEDDDDDLDLDDGPSGEVIRPTPPNIPREQIYIKRGVW